MLFGALKPTDADAVQVDVMGRPWTSNALRGTETSPVYFISSVEILVSMDIECSSGH